MKILKASVFLANIEKLVVKNCNRLNAHRLIMNALKIKELRKVSFGLIGNRVNQKNLRPNLMLPLTVAQSRYKAKPAKIVVEINST